MRAPFTQLYVHLVWSTWDRLPLITLEIEPLLHKSIGAKCQELKCLPLAIGGIEDHVHVLVRLNPIISVAQLVKEIKGASSHFVNHMIDSESIFKWQGGYGAFTLRKSEIDIVKAYIGNQKDHHKSGNIKSEWEKNL